MTMFEDVGAFHAKFELPCGTDGPPTVLPPDLFSYRFKFLLEELAELAEARGAQKAAWELRQMIADAELLDDVEVVTDGRGLADQADALIDIAWIAMGTGHFMGLDWRSHWAEVRRANMAKQRGVTAKRGHVLDVFKPAGWRGPDHEAILAVSARALR